MTKLLERLRWRLYLLPIAVWFRRNVLGHKPQYVLWGDVVAVKRLEREEMLKMGYVPSDGVYLGK